MYTNDPVNDAECYMAEQEKQLQKRPKCSYCEEHIQDEYAYYINGDYICESCLNDQFRITVDFYSE